MNYLLNNHNISYLIKSFVSLLLLFWMLGYMNCAQRENFWGWFFGISGHTVTFWLVMMVIRAACMSDGDGSQILTKWWMVIISGPPPLCTYDFSVHWNVRIFSFQLSHKKKKGEQVRKPEKICRTWGSCVHLIQSKSSKKWESFICVSIP